MSHLDLRLTPILIQGEKGESSTKVWEAINSFGYSGAKAQRQTARSWDESSSQTRYDLFKT